ncbi:MAG: preprotein translocase subunit SecE [Thermodesulfobacterium geofontis]|uniref:Protein translocase subunit SecE n=1 Tax=Thermodesulfobacterium geofontis TaxID=1295609 RepID=A0A2N7PPA9_9BACT|nr:MAG: preprotein translocase subunit SecE [Thermodesulfobacterium geofontis]
MKVKEVKNKIVREKEENFILRSVKFLKEVKIEAKKITWPPKKQVFLSALMIMFFSILIGAYLGLLDMIYNALISFLVR